MKALGLVAGAALVCCASLPSGGPPMAVPYSVDNAGVQPFGYVVRYDPPPIYELWWEEVRECSGVARPPLPYERIRFYAVGPDSAFQDGEQSVYALQDVGRPENILVAAPLLMRADIIRHEMLHAITSPTRYQGHPRAVFRGRCDTLVYHAPGT